MCGGAERVRAQFGHKSFSARSGARKCLILNGEMAEWSIAHAWKACVGETLPRVRIPLSPPTFAHLANARELRLASQRRLQAKRAHITRRWIVAFGSFGLAAPVKHFRKTSGAA